MSAKLRAGAAATMFVKVENLLVCATCYGASGCGSKCRSTLPIRLPRPPVHTCGHSKHLLIDLRPLLLRHICKQLLPLPLKLLCCLGRLALLEVLLQCNNRP